jgi:NTE family protein
MSEKSYALVLGGGGAKCSYQIGVWKALRELGIKISAYIGTSAGALNAAILANDKYDDAVKMWKTLKIENIVSIPKSLLNKEILVPTKDNFRRINAFTNVVLRNKGLDSGPLRAILADTIEEKLLRKNKTELGIVTYQINNLTPLEIFLEDIPDGQLLDFLVASATFPGFKAVNIRGKYYIDGGLHNNVPYSLAKSRGYTSVIVADVSGIGINQKIDFEGMEMIYIKNSVDLGGILDFNPQNAERNMKIGYLDTMKAFGQIGGIKYFYNKDEKIMSKLEDILLSDSFQSEYAEFLSPSADSRDAQNRARLLRTLLPKEFRIYKDLAIPFFECAAIALNIEVTNNYGFLDLLKKIGTEFLASEKNDRTVDEGKSLFAKIRLWNPFRNRLNKNPEYRDLLFTKAGNEFPVLVCAAVFYRLLKRCPL